MNDLSARDRPQPGTEDMECIENMADEGDKSCEGRGTVGHGSLATRSGKMTALG